MLTRNTTRCSSCGATNPRDTDRCRICTKPLFGAGTATQRAYTEDLFNQAVTRHTALYRRPGTYLVLLLVGVIALNYFVLGFGPDWAHRDFTTAGADWAQVDEVRNLMQVDLPGGRPEITDDGGITRLRVGLDGNGGVVLDDTVTAPADRARGLRDLDTLVIVAVVPAGGDPISAAASDLAAAAPGIRLLDVTAEGPDEAGWTTIAARYEGVPEDRSTGELRARTKDAGGLRYVALTLHTGNVDDTVLDRLTNTLEPAGG